MALTCHGALAANPGRTYRHRQAERMLSPSPNTAVAALDGRLAKTTRASLVALARYGLVVKGALQLLVGLLALFGRFTGF